MEVDAKTIVIAFLVIAVLFLLFQSGDTSSTGAAVGYQQVNVPARVGGC